MINTIVLTTNKCKSMKINTDLETMKAKAVTALRNYYRDTEHVECTDGFDAAFLHLMGYKPTETAYTYNLVCINALVACTDPNISTTLISSMGEDSYKELIRMMDRMLIFSRDLQQSHYRAYTQAMQIENYGTQCNDEQEAYKELQYIIETTANNMAALRSRHPKEKFTHPFNHSKVTI